STAAARSLPRAAEVGTRIATAAVSSKIPSAGLDVAGAVVSLVTAIVAQTPEIMAIPVPAIGSRAAKPNTEEYSWSGTVRTKTARAIVDPSAGPTKPNCSELKPTVATASDMKASGSGLPVGRSTM